VWVTDLSGVFTHSRSVIDRSSIQGLKSDGVLAAIRPGLEAIGYQVERGKSAKDKIERPVLFGDQGAPRVRYDVDAWLADPGVVLEVEAGRAMGGGNAFYRDLVRSALIINARYLAIAVMVSYRANSGITAGGTPDYEYASNQLTAIYASGRLHLPFEGILLIGY
jgi:hypothetical protein